jgi:hypothetical protein
MSVRRLAQAIVVGMMFVFGAAAAQADVTWNAYDGFISGPTAQSASNTWQYSYNPNGDNNSGYTLLDRWGDNGDGVAIDGWTRSADDYWHNQVVLKNPAASELQVHPLPGFATTIGWLSPIAGTVNASFSVTDRNGGGGDGVEYWLYKSNALASASLKHGFVDNGQDWTSGPITQSGISVAAGDMLYLRVGPGIADSHGHDMTGVTFAVTAVPEPGTLVLIGTGLIGLLCYAWRKPQ